MAGADFSKLDFSPTDFNPSDFNPRDFASRDFAVEPASGPPYPPSPEIVFQPNLGTFQIGDSPIGDVIPFSYWLTIISQYANSDITTTLIANFQQYIDQTRNMDNLYDNIWNVMTANGYGLDVWGRIVGVQRTVQIQTSKFFGFNEMGTTYIEPFGPGGVGSFYNGVFATTSYQLSDQTFRTLIIAKAMANITNGSIPAINAILRSLFPGRGNCYVADGGNMTMQYVFDFPLAKFEYAIIATSGVLPKPTGVAASIVYPGFM